MTNFGMDDWLKERGFTVYPNIRSNYADTLSSNISIFEMRHHYYERHKLSGEVYFGRRIIAGDNFVVNFFEKNGYETYLLNFANYLTFDGCFYSYCHTMPKTVSLFGAEPFIAPDDVDRWANSVNSTLERFPKDRRFVFIEHSMSPAHISYTQGESRGREKERRRYESKLREANRWLQAVIEEIQRTDPDPLIILMADHGAYVGYDYVQQATTLTEDPDLIRSSFSIYLAIRWPTTYDGRFDDKFATPVNVFRYIFSFLTDTDSFLSSREEDVSYLNITEPKPGIYAAIDESNRVVLKPRSGL